MAKGGIEVQFLSGRVCSVFRMIIPGWYRLDNESSDLGYGYTAVLGEAFVDMLGQS